MLTRRDGVVALVAACVTMTTVVWAQSIGRPPLNSKVYDWEKIPAEPTDKGEKRNFFRMPTATLDQLSCHVTTIGPGEIAHPPHSHPEEELVIIKEGTIEAMQNGQVTRVGPGSILFEASNELHGMRNVGDTPATYFVLKWWSPGMLENTGR